MRYNTSQFDLWWMPQIRLLSFGELVPGNPADKKFDQIDGDFVREYVRSLPAGIPAIVDLEGSTVADEKFGLDHWHYELDPTNAVNLRHEMVHHIKDERPDLDVGITEVPARIRESETFDQVVERELEYYRHVTSMCDTLYISGYVQPSETFPEWAQRMIETIGAAQFIHRKKPKVVVTYKTRHQQIDAKSFGAILRWLKENGLDAVFWISESETEIPWQYKWQLFYS